MFLVENKQRIEKGKILSRCAVQSVMTQKEREKERKTQRRT